MRVIETFITYVPRENIRRSANYFVQDSSNHNGHYLSQHSHEPAHQEGFHGCWYSEGYISGTQVKAPLSSDAAETVVTREELMRAYDLVEQDYTLWFGGECAPVSNGTRVDYICDDGQVGNNVTARMLNWKDGIIAYRLSRSTDKDVAPLVELDPVVTIYSRKPVNFYESLTDKLETRLKKLDNITGGAWPVSDDEKLLVTADNQLIRFEPEKLITRAQWDDYVSRKIRVGDKVLVSKGTVSHEVVFIGEKSAFLRTETGLEFSARLNSLTRIPQ